MVEALCTYLHVIVHVCVGETERTANHNMEMFNLDNKVAKVPAD